MISISYYNFSIIILNFISLRMRNVENLFKYPFTFQYSFARFQFVQNFEDTLQEQDAARQIFRGNIDAVARLLHWFSFQACTSGTVIAGRCRSRRSVLFVEGQSDRIPETWASIQEILWRAAKKFQKAFPRFWRCGSAGPHCSCLKSDSF